MFLISRPLEGGGFTKRILNGQFALLVNFGKGKNSLLSTNY